MIITPEHKKLFKHLNSCLNQKSEIFFDLRSDQFCIEVEKKIFHKQVDVWENITNEYVDTIPLCNTQNKYAVGNFDENDKLNCSQCIDLLKTK